MVYKECTFKLPEPPPSHLWLQVCVHCIVLQPTQNESDNDQRQQNHHMFSKMSGLRGILVDIYIDVSRRHFWKSWEIHTTVKIQNFKIWRVPTENGESRIHLGELQGCLGHTWCIISTCIAIIELFSFVNNCYFLST